MEILIGDLVRAMAGLFQAITARGRRAPAPVTHDPRRFAAHDVPLLIPPRR